MIIQITRRNIQGLSPLLERRFNLTHLEAAVLKYVLFKPSQNSRENIFAGVTY